MHGSLSRRRFLKLSILGTITAGATGCGSILYPERIGQPRCGALDWKVVALDTIGLLFFFVPGVIAFVVDFVNGTIYLPAGQYGDVGGEFGSKKFVEVDVPPDELNRARIEQVVSKQIEQPVRLDDGTFETKKLDTLDEFWPAHRTYSNRRPVRPSE
jgi:hypothetical protein